MAELFFTKSGWLTPYAMACGYLQSQDSGNVQLKALAPNCGYEISVHKDSRFYCGLDWRKWGGFQSENSACVFMQFDSVTDARRVFRNIMRGELKRRYESNPEIARSVIC